jgi:hypothetical protein
VALLQRCVLTLGVGCAAGVQKEDQRRGQQGTCVDRTSCDAMRIGQRRSMASGSISFWVSFQGSVMLSARRWAAEATEEEAATVARQATAARPTAGCQMF